MILTDGAPRRENRLSLTWDLCSGVAGGFGVFGSEPPAGVQCRSRARAVRSPSVTRPFNCSRFRAAAASASVYRFARRLVPSGAAASPRSLSKLLAVHPFATGMTIAHGVVEESAVPLPFRTADCAGRRSSTTALTISLFPRPSCTAHPSIRLLSRLLFFSSLRICRHVCAKCNEIRSLVRRWWIVVKS